MAARRKKGFIPSGLIYWSWWKKYILKSYKARKELCAKSDIDRPKLVEYLQTWKKYFPAQVLTSSQRKSEFFSDCWLWYKSTLSPSLPYHIEEDLKGLGLYADCDFSSSKLWGTAIYLEPEAFIQLQHLEYPSLAANSGYTYAIVGPASLINHCCKSKRSFSFPCKKNIAPFPELLGYKIITTFPAQIIKGGEEILVKYCDSKELHFVCYCCKDIN